MINPRKIRKIRPIRGFKKSINLGSFTIHYSKFTIQAQRPIRGSP
jgi:hypothetical protein